MSEIQEITEKPKRKRSKSTDCLVLSLTYEPSDDTVKSAIWSNLSKQAAACIERARVTPAVMRSRVMVAIDTGDDESVERAREYIKSVIDELQQTGSVKSEWRFGRQPNEDVIFLNTDGTIPDQSGDAASDDAGEADDQSDQVGEGASDV